MLTIRSFPRRLVLVMVASVMALLLVGCGGQGSQAPSAADLKAFNGGDGKMPDDFKAKLQAAQQNGAIAQQQASQAARQRAAQQPVAR